MKAVRIIGVGHDLPGNPVTTKEVIEWGNINIFDEKWVEEKIGIKTRHVSRKFTPSRKAELQPGCATSDLCARAATQAIQQAGISHLEIDMIIVATCTPDYPVPGTSTLVQEKLAIPECATMDVRSACCGTFQAIVSALQYCRTGYFRTVLVCGADTGTVFGDSNLGKPDVLKKDAVNWVLIGDGAGAVILRGFDESEIPYGIEIMYTTIKSVGTNQKPGFYMPAGGCVQPFSQEVLDGGQHYFAHDYRAVLQHGPELYWRSLQDTLRANNIGLHDISLLIPHQANGSIKYFAEKFGAHSDRVYFNFDKVGNCANASCLIGLSEVIEQDKMDNGDLILLMGAESTKWLYGSILLKFYSPKKRPDQTKIPKKEKVTIMDRVYSGCIYWGLENYFRLRKFVGYMWGWFG